MTLSIEDFESYMDDPVSADKWLRGKFNIPHDRYYTVSIWPNPGGITLTGSREVKANKISKSDNP